MYTLCVPIVVAHTFLSCNALQAQTLMLVDDV